MFLKEMKLKKYFAFLIFLLFVAPFLKAQDGPVSLNKEQLEWGETQFRQMLKDRPTMRLYVKEEDNLWNWTVRQFAGETGGNKILWDPSDPLPIWDAQSCASDLNNHKLACIKITKNFTQDGNQIIHKGDPKDGIVLWGEVIWELFNVKNFQRFSEISARAENGILSREAFIVENAVAEHESGREAHQFFLEVWVPHCQKLGLPFEDEQLMESGGKDLITGMDDVDTIDELFQSGNFHYKSWGDWYDKYFLPQYLKRQDFVNEAKKTTGSTPTQP
jgi:hypothetical protein